MKRISFILWIMMLLFPIGGITNGLYAQSIGEWQVYPSYWKATQNIAVGSTIYSLMNGRLLRYDAEDKSVKTYDSLHDLNDVNITKMGYSAEAKRLILAYDTGNIDLLDDKDNVLNIASLMNANNISSKTITDIIVLGSTAYLTTGFGFITIDLKEGIVLDTYRLGWTVNTLCFAYNQIYLSTTVGIYYADADANLHSASSWQKGAFPANNFYKLICFDNNIYGLRTNYNGLLQLLKNGDAANWIERDAVSSLTLLNDGKMAVAKNNCITIYSDAKTSTTYSIDATCLDFNQGSKGVYWASAENDGLKAYKLADDAFKATGETIQPNSPKNNLCSDIHFVGNRLLVAGGTNSFNDRIEATAMIFEDGKWTNLVETPLDTRPLTGINTVRLVQDPNDDNHFFAGSSRNGLKEYRDGKLIKIYNSDNSPLYRVKTVAADYQYYYLYDAATCLHYDADGNLWMANQLTDSVVCYITPKGKWGRIQFNEIAEAEYVSAMQVTSSGVHFLGCRSGNGPNGLFGFTTTSNLGKTTQHKLISHIINQDGAAVNQNICYAITEDMLGSVWLGTENGLFVIDDPTTFFDDDFRFTQIKIARNDGSGLADYMLNGVTIYSIAVDGGNRKWIGTKGNGVYLVSADGTELIHHFTKENSPLLSNNVTSVAVNATSGLVMIGTDAGLCSFMSDATEAEEELDGSNVIAYPNPVRPDYNGPIRIEGLTFNAEVKILSSTGQLVWSGVSNGGTYTWNGCNKQGRRVSSGVYHVVANTEDGGKAVVCRIIVIK